MTDFINIYSKSFITVNGSGTITLMVGTTIIELEGVDGSTTLDTPMMEAYKGIVSKNSAMSGDFPTLTPGLNGISWTGSITSVVIQPNWRFL